MWLRPFAGKIKRRIQLELFKIQNRGKEKFECPVCKYNGPFYDLDVQTGFRKHARCPKCSAVERHRLQYLVFCQVLKTINPSQLKMLHFAPEKFFHSMFQCQFGTYETADIEMPGVDHYVDLRELPFEDQSYDFVYASHVLEHIKEDRQAVKEIRRILRPGGIAILPVPVVAQQTVEYPEANPNECGHVRAPGVDYFDRYEEFFAKVERFDSNSLPRKHQLFLYEDRTQWPSKESPFLPYAEGEKHIDIVPVCFV